MDSEFVPYKIEVELKDREKKLQLKPYYKTKAERDHDILGRKFKDDLDFFKEDKKDEWPKFMDYKIEIIPQSLKK